MSNLRTVSQVFSFFPFLFLFLFFIAGMFLFFSFLPACCSFVFVLFFLFFFFLFFFRWDFSKFSLARLQSAVFILSLAALWIVYSGSVPCYDSMTGPRHQINTSCIVTLYIHICMQKLNDAIKRSRHSSLEKYTSHFYSWKGSKGLLKVLLCERWVGDWTELQHIDPYSYGHNSASFPFSWAAQSGAWGPSLSGIWSSFQHLLSNWLKLPVHRVILLFYTHSIQPVDSQG